MCKVQNSAYYIAHMQFLAARSLWINLLLVRYSIPLATWMQISSSLFSTVLFCSERKNIQPLLLMSHDISNYYVPVIFYPKS